MSCLILTTLLITGAMTAAPAFADPGGGRSEKEAARIAAVTAPATDFSKAEPYEALPGGGATSKVTPDTNAFSQFSETLTFEQELKFKIGNGLFRKTWVSAPSSTLASDGLGPLYNARACQRCHLKDGRGHPPAAGRRPRFPSRSRSPFRRSGRRCALSLPRSPAITPQRRIRLMARRSRNSPPRG